MASPASFGSANPAIVKGALPLPERPTLGTQVPTSVGQTTMLHGDPGSGLEEAAAWIAEASVPSVGPVITFDPSLIGEARDALGGESAPFFGAGAIAEVGRDRGDRSGHASHALAVSPSRLRTSSSSWLEPGDCPPDPRRPIGCSGDRGLCRVEQARPPRARPGSAGPPDGSNHQPIRAGAPAPAVPRPAALRHSISDGPRRQPRTAPARIPRTRRSRRKSWLASRRPVSLRRVALQAAGGLVSASMVS
jgi:hypothetical protein